MPTQASFAWVGIFFVISLCCEDRQAKSWKSVIQTSTCRVPHPSFLCLGGDFFSSILPGAPAKRSRDTRNRKSGCPSIREKALSSETSPGRWVSTAGFVGGFYKRGCQEKTLRPPLKARIVL